MLSQPRVRQVLRKLADNAGEAWRRDCLLRIHVSVSRVRLFADSQKALGQSVILLGGRLDPGRLAMIVGKRCSGILIEQFDCSEVRLQEPDKGISIEDLFVVGSNLQWPAIGRAADQQATGAEDAGVLGDRQLIFLDVFDCFKRNDDIGAFIRERDRGHAADEVSHVRLAVFAASVVNRLGTDVDAGDTRRFSRSGEEFGSIASSTGNIDDLSPRGISGGEAIASEVEFRSTGIKNRNRRVHAL